MSTVVDISALRVDRGEGLLLIFQCRPIQKPFHKKLCKYHSNPVVKISNNIKDYCMYSLKGVIFINVIVSLCIRQFNLFKHASRYFY